MIQARVANMIQTGVSSMNDSGASTMNDSGAGSMISCIISFKKIVVVFDPYKSLY